MNKQRPGLFTLLRFLNLLEPGKNILSITKIAMWVSIVGIVAATARGVPMDLTGMAALFTTGSLYAWRRYVYWKSGEFPPESSNEPAYPIG